MNGVDLSALPNSLFDLVAAYSVLHHIPDYLGAVEELARVCKPGGVIVLDHERTEQFWKGDAVYDQFKRAASRFDWRKYLLPSNYIHKVRRLWNPRHTNEGDIHVWPDDHIEWPLIVELLVEKGFEVVVEEDYLVYHTLYHADVFRHFQQLCSDTRLMIFRKFGS